MSEHNTQSAFIQWCRWNEAKYPELEEAYSIPNGAYLAGDKVQRAIQMNRLKAEGFKTGVPDWCLPVPLGGYASLYIEFKHGKNKLSDAQKQFIRRLEKRGHCVAVCYSVDEAINVTKEYLDGK